MAGQSNEEQDEQTGETSPPYKQHGDIDAGPRMRPGVTAFRHVTIWSTVALEPPQPIQFPQRYKKVRAQAVGPLSAGMCTHTWKECGECEIPSITAPSYQDGSLRRLAKAQAVNRPHLQTWCYAAHTRP
jgi:hypothetical protein